MSKWARVNRARARRPGGAKTTKAEQLWANRLQLLLLAGDILWWAREPVSLRLGHRCHYIPDFASVTPEGLFCFDEVKGTAGWKLDDESRTKWKSAGELYPFFQFRSCIQQKRGGWKLDTYEPVQGFPPASESGPLPATAPDL